MSGRRRDHIGRGNTLSTVIYILIVAALLACMGYLYYYSRQQKQSSRDRIAQLKQEESGVLESYEEGLYSKEETSEASTEETTKETVEESTLADTSAVETSSAEETETASELSSEESSDAAESVSDEQVSSDSFLPVMPTDSQTNAESSTSVHTVRVADPNAVKKEISVIVLNGTRKDGIAGYWKERFQAEGFEDVVAATYKAAIDSETVIYVAEKKQAEYFKKFFPNADVKIGSLEAYMKYIAFAADQDATETYDVWVVVGMNDAKTE